MIKLGNDSNLGPASPRPSPVVLRNDPDKRNLVISDDQNLSVTLCVLARQLQCHLKCHTVFLHFSKERLYHVNRSSGQLREEGGVGVSILTVYRAIYIIQHHTISHLPSDRSHWQSWVQTLGLTSNSPYWWQLSLTVTISGAQYTPLGPLHTERSERYLSENIYLPQLFSLYHPSPEHGVELTGMRPGLQTLALPEPSGESAI